MRKNRLTEEVIARSARHVRIVSRNGEIEPSVFQQQQTSLAVGTGGIGGEPAQEPKNEQDCRFGRAFGGCWELYLILQPATTGSIPGITLLGPFPDLAPS